MSREIADRSEAKKNKCAQVGPSAHQTEARENENADPGPISHKKTLGARKSADPGPILHEKTLGAHIHSEKREKGALFYDGESLSATRKSTVYLD